MCAQSWEHKEAFLDLRSPKGSPHFRTPCRYDFQNDNKIFQSIEQLQQKFINFFVNLIKLLQINSEESTRVLKSNFKVSNLHSRGVVDSNMILIILMLMLDIACADNSSHTRNNHRLSFAWTFNPIIGLVGTILNSFILYIFYSERQIFIKPINSLIW